MVLASPFPDLAAFRRVFFRSCYPRWRAYHGLPADSTRRGITFMSRYDVSFCYQASYGIGILAGYQHAKAYH